MRLFNMTPHEITIVWSDDTTQTFPSLGIYARVNEIRESQEDETDFTTVRLGEVEKLPPWVYPASDDDINLYLVSNMVRCAVPHRPDVVSPGRLIRDEFGVPIGCLGLTVNEGFRAYILPFLLMDPRKGLLKDTLEPQ